MEVQLGGGGMSTRCGGQCVNFKKEKDYEQMTVRFERKAIFKIV